MTIAFEFGAVSDAGPIRPRNEDSVGDGGSGELTGAAQAGMTPFHLVTVDAEDALVYDAEAGWTGARINALSEVLALIGS